jgi:hypothetical protein
MHGATSNVTERTVQGHQVAITNHELAAGGQASRYWLRLRKAWR